MHDKVLKPQPTEITTLIQLLNDETNTKPTELEITILPDRPKKNNDDGDEDDGDNDGDGDDDDSDYYFLKDGKHLGIHAPNVPHLARTFRQEVYTVRSAYLLNRQMEQGNKSHKSRDDDDDDENENENENDDPIDQIMLPIVDIQNRLWDATICLLLLCPDHASAWSDRKRILIDKWEEKCRLELVKHKGKDSSNDDDDDDNNDSSRLDLWHSEIEYLNLLFSQHSKA